MKLSVVVFLLAIFSTVTMSAQIEGFRDLKWGIEPNEKFQIKTIENKEKISTYTLTDENFNIGEVSFDVINYQFYSNHLYGINLITKGELKSFADLREVFTAKYGYVEKDDLLGYRYIWKDNEGYIRLSYDPIRKIILVMILGNKFFNQSIEYKKKLAKDAASNSI